LALTVAITCDVSTVQILWRICSVEQFNSFWIPCNQQFWRWTPVTVIIYCAFMPQL